MDKHGFLPRSQLSYESSREWETNKSRVIMDWVAILAVSLMIFWAAVLAYLSVWWFLQFLGRKVKEFLGLNVNA